MKNLIKINQFQKNVLNERLIKKLNKNFNKVYEDIKYGINLENTFFNLLSDNYIFNFKKSDLKKFKKFQNIAIIGMGGSVLGSEAIYEVLRKKIKKKVYFFNDIDIEKILDFKKKIKINKTVFIIISKSGNTIETISNLLSLNIIKRNSTNIILISEIKDNIISNIAKRFNLFHIEHKKNIGGRFSVLSEVGLVPAYLMGINIEKLRKNIKKNFDLKEKKFLKDSCVKLACILIKKKYSNLIFLNYEPKLKKFFSWCQQLIAESLGKKGKGFLPFVSSVPKDHHSLLQLYLDGPKNNFFHIFSFQSKSDIKLKSKKYSKKLTYLHKKKLSVIKFAQKDALRKALVKNKISFREFRIKNLNEEMLSELFTYFILETIIVGNLIKINPFTQPSVEQVKYFTRKSLN